MNRTVKVFLSLLLFISSAAIAKATELSSKTLAITIDPQGKLTKLYDIKNRRDHLLSQTQHWKSLVRETNDQQRPLHSYLISIKTWDSKDTFNPQKMTASRVESNTTHLSFEFKHNITLTVAAKVKDDYLTFELIDAAPIDRIDKVFWGPYYTSIDHQWGSWLGLLRNEQFSLGMLSLEPNTYAKTYGDMTAYVAEPNKGDCIGANLQLESWNNSISREYSPYFAKSLKCQSTPVEGLNTIGSKIALYGTGVTKDAILNTIERIQIQEGLPHPKIDGTWIKRHPLNSASTIMPHSKHETIDDFYVYLDIAEAAGIRNVYMGNTWNNWGTFDLNPKAFPGGMPQLQKLVKDAKKRDIIVGTHNLSAFIIPIQEGATEPYLTPPDERLLTLKQRTELTVSIAKDATRIPIKDNPENFLGTSKKGVPFYAVIGPYIQIGQEIIKYSAVDMDTLELTGCERAQFGTTASAYQAGQPIKRLCNAIYKNFYPGSADMLEEVARNLGQKFKESGMGIGSFDGYESGKAIGMSQYGMELFSSSFYDQIGHHIQMNSSRGNNYFWHKNTYLSWGEPWHHDRYPSLQYRLYRIEQVADNLVDKKIGQLMFRNGGRLEHNKDLMEYWLARCAGYDAGFDLYLERTRLENLSETDQTELLDAIKMWEEARLSSFFTEQQKLELRQLDTKWTLKRKGDSFELVYLGKPKNYYAPKLELFVDEAATIDESWFHDYFQYSKAWITKDYRYQYSKEQPEVTWDVNPQSVTKWNGEQIQFTLRVPEDAKEGIKSPYFYTARGWVVIDTELKPGEYIVANKPDGTKTVQVYSADHKVLRDVRVSRFLPVLKKDDQNVSFGYLPVGLNPPEVVCNFRYTNNPQEGQKK